ncbi:MAG: sigma-54 interaction domain-containing protein [Verrucomicrobiales bacterium]
MPANHARPFDEDAALKAIVEGTAAGTGQAFFSSLVENLAKVLEVHGAWVTEYLPESERLKAFAFWLGGEWVPDYEYDICGTPCEPVVESKKLFHVAENVIELYPDDPDLGPLGAVSYMGVPLNDTDGTMLGHLAVLDNKSMPDNPRMVGLFRIFAARAAAELQRLRAERGLREREEKLTRLVGGAMDAIVELDSRLEVSLINPAAECLLGCDRETVVGTSFTEFLSDESCEKLDLLIEELNTAGSDAKALWIPGGLEAIHADSEKLSLEATLSRSDLGSQPFYTLILRNVNDRLEAEQKIEALTDENLRLEQELSTLREHDEVVGRSKPIMKALDAVARVAGTDASVLLLGETGTGKEVFARAIHQASARCDQPLVKLNCAAIPANLIESEFFGHEKGAFTGATSRREGRFALAHGGTIFLDEIGELPIDLQSKLLRVLQEGEFEPVGCANTVAVDVRIVAATNRDLQTEIDGGNFREDLFFRLNVFPINIPPLHERGRDIILLAEFFLVRLCGKMGRPVPDLNPPLQAELMQYHWPGNVRELQNVLERALIMSPPGRLELSLGGTRSTANPAPAPATGSGEILSMSQLQEIERANFIRALDSCAWKISGNDGAANLLGLKPSTLSSRLKALGIERSK